MLWYGCRSEPQTQDRTIRTSASVGSCRIGSGTFSTRTSPAPYIKVADGVIASRHQIARVVGSTSLASDASDHVTFELVAERGPAKRYLYRSLSSGALDKRPGRFGNDGSTGCTRQNDARTKSEPVYAYVEGPQRSDREQLALEDLRCRAEVSHRAKATAHTQEVLWPYSKETPTNSIASWNSCRRRALTNRSCLPPRFSPASRN